MKKPRAQKYSIWRKTAAGWVRSHLHYCEKMKDLRRYMRALGPGFVAKTKTGKPLIV